MRPATLATAGHPAKPDARRALLGAGLASMLARCGGSGSTPSITDGEPPLSPMAAIGQLIFTDTALSASGRQSCATCHVPSRAFAGADSLAVPLGGVQKNLPTLYNVATRQNYFHNDVFTQLNDVVSGYATRDTDAQRWHRREGGAPDTPCKDLSPFLQASVNVAELPYNARLAPTLTAAEINLLVVFLCTLTDGYDPAHADAYATQPQCLQAAASASQ
jgi:cytochrome c peroxidase